MSIIKEISVAYAPATVANLNCGFDVLGAALHSPGDTVELRKSENAGIQIKEIIGAENLPLEAEKNVCCVAINAMLKHLGLIDIGLEVRIRKGNKVGSGLGSSAASAAAAVMALNGMLEKPLIKRTLIPFAMAGEELASGSAHADNVAPSILGGITLVRSYHPLDVISLVYPTKLSFLVVHQHIEIRTSDARNILPAKINQSTAIEQWGNLAAFVSGLAAGDKTLIKRSMNDVVAEPFRKGSIPNFDALKEIATEFGALGFGISGSGPSVFALFDNENDLKACELKCSALLDKHQISFKSYASEINPNGAVLIDKF